jgi:hypothetical protein
LAGTPGQIHWTDNLPPVLCQESSATVIFPVKVEAQNVSGAFVGEEVSIALYGTGSCDKAAYPNPVFVQNSDSMFVYAVAGVLLIAIYPASDAG